MFCTELQPRNLDALCYPECGPQHTSTPEHNKSVLTKINNSRQKGKKKEKEGKKKEGRNGDRGWVRKPLVKFLLLSQYDVVPSLEL